MREREPTSSPPFDDPPPSHPDVGDDSRTIPVRGLLRSAKGQPCGERDHPGERLTIGLDTVTAGYLAGCAQ